MHRTPRILLFAIITIYSLLVITAVRDVSNEPREMLLFLCYALTGLACGGYFLFSLVQSLRGLWPTRTLMYATLLSTAWVLSIMWLSHAAHAAEAVKILTSSKYARCKEQAIPMDSGLLGRCNDKQSYFMGSNNFFELIIYDTSKEAGLSPLKRSHSWQKALKLSDHDGSYKKTVRIRRITGDYYLISHQY